MAGSQSNHSYPDEAHKLIQKIEQSATLLILVWGSSKGGGKFYDKRQDVCRELKKRFPKSDIRTSENEELRDITQPAFSSFLEEELLHAEAADLILAIDTTRGAWEEIARFSAYPHIASKIVVLSHESSSSEPGFAQEVRRYLKVCWYSDEDFDNCSLAKVICVKEARGLALNHYVARRQ